MQASEGSAITQRTDTSPSNRKRKHPPTGSAGPVRKSLRLDRTLRSDCEVEVPTKSTENQCKRLQQPVHFPSPPPSHPPEQNFQRKRKTSVGDLDHLPLKVPRASEEPHEAAPPIQTRNPVEHWIFTNRWPDYFANRVITMSESQSKEPSKKGSSSAHRSDLKRKRAACGVYMEKSSHLLSESKKFCDELLNKKHRYVSCVGYPEDKFLNILAHGLFSNETKIQRDIMPRVVPPLEYLRFHGEPDLLSICEEVNAIWYRCEPKGGTIPKPDYTAGLKPEVFTAVETRKLQNYCSPNRPFLFTANVCFPFLTCEAKSGDQALSRAQSQNINSGSIAVNAIVQLYQAAFGEKEPERVEALYGDVLAFSVSHDHDSVRIWGHYAIMQNGLKFYYHEIDAFFLSVRDGQHKNQGYDFTRNVYKEVVPKHLKRIKDAVEQLRDPEDAVEKPGDPEIVEAASSTGQSFDTSVPSVGRDGDSQQQPHQSHGSQGVEFKIPGTPASTTVVVELKKQLRKEREEASKQMDSLVEQLDQQREEAEQQREKASKQMDTLVEQLDQQRAEAKQQRDQLEELINLLRQKSLSGSEPK
ncbi:MAG: hypothetical protein M1814_005033 [Vezdaea aestivalis]|nr:MAG: hypothetical protein M1814_005033 [Vezdaea aestivalis]